MIRTDILIIGAGIVGLATAYQLLRLHPHLNLIVLDKENTIAAHQTGRNSGVIHSGIYYKPGSLKAKNCIEGRRELLSFCDEHNIPYKPFGKVIIATHPSELSRLQELALRGTANGVRYEQIGPERLQEIEPHAQGLQALWIPDCYSINYKQVAHSLKNEIEKMGGQVLLERKVLKITDAFVETTRETLTTHKLIACAGLHSDTLAKQSLGSLDSQILPFRGEYYELKEEKRHLVKGLIYPVPDPTFPFLGVHLTRMIDNTVEAGPNAVLALAKEGYRKQDLSPRDCLRMLRYPGFWKMASRYWRMGFYEYARSFRKKLFVRDLQKLVPAIQEQDLVPGNTGIRAQVVTREGKMLDDFAILKTSNRIHVLNAPSPAATASFAIGRQIAVECQ